MIDGEQRDAVVDAITNSGVRLGDELVLWGRIGRADACPVSAGR